jgi:hypothetical protein
LWSCQLGPTAFLVGGAEATEDQVVLRRGASIGCTD